MGREDEIIAERKRKIAELRKRAADAGLTEEEINEVSDTTVKSYMGKAVHDTLSGKKDRNPGIKRAMSRLAGNNTPLTRKAG